MKKFMKSFALLAVAALGLSACNDDKLVPDNGNADGKFVTVHFGAEAAIEGATKATLTTEDEKTFKSAWENGDVLSVEYISPETADNKIITATWNGTSFEAKGLPNETGAWDYTACYPKPDEKDTHIDFGGVRTQKGRAYNSIYDVMIGNKSTKNSAAGKDDDGSNVVFNMTRQTAVAYFHLTGGPADEEVESATLSVEDGFIASQYAYISDFAFAPTKDLTDITITFDAGTAPKASDFQLWYNVLPTNYTKMTLTVETANHTLTISRNATGMYEAGKLYKVVKNIPADKWVKKGGETPVASSYKIEFNNKSKGVSSIETTTKASTFVVTGAEYLEAQPFSNPSNAYYGGNETNGLPLRIGKKDASGSITMALSKAGQVNANKIILSAKQFFEGQSKLIGVNGSAKQQPGDDYTNLEFPLDGSPLTSIKLDTDGYIYVQSITVVSGPVDNTIPSLSVDQTSKVWAADATDAFVVNVTVNSEGGDWTVTPETLSWATIVVDKTAGTITVTPNRANTAQTANEATLTIAHASDASLKKEITLKQNAAAATANDGSLERPYTAAEAIAVIDASPKPSEGVTNKHVKGVVKAAPSFNATYSSLSYDIVSGETTLYIYSGRDLGNADFVGAEDLKVGDEVVVFGTLKKYTDKAGDVKYELDKTNYLISINGKTEIYRGLAVSGQKTAFTVGDAFEFGGKALQVWRGKTDVDVTASATFSGYDMSTEGKQTVTVTVGEETVAYEITVNPAGAALPITISKKISDMSGNPTDGTKVSSMTMDDVITLSASTTGHNGKIYGEEWRLYASDKGTMTVSSKAGYVIESITVTFTVKSSGTLKYGENNVTTGKAVEVSGSSVVFTVGAGQVKVTAVSVTYKQQ